MNWQEISQDWHHQWRQTTTELAAERARAAYWRRSALGTWAVNLVLSAVIAWLVWG
jgi:hypothetical protein